MASRSSSGMGVMVALVIFILLSLALLLTTMLFYTKMEQARTDMENAEEDLRVFVDPKEREHEDIKYLKSQASKAGGRMSVVKYLLGEMQGVMSLVANNQNMTRNELIAQMERLGLSEDVSLLSSYSSISQDYDSEKERTALLNAQMNDVRNRMENEVTRREQLEQDHLAAISALQAEIDRIQNRANDYANRVNEAERSMDDRVAAIRDNYEQQISDFNVDIESERARVAQLTNDISALNDRLRGITHSSMDEAVLPDGFIQEFGERDTVYIDLGQEDHVVLGMTFEVYGNTTELKPDSMGNTPRGKATIEVTHVRDNISTARIIRSTPGRAVVEGDIIINAIYDKDKKYTCFVYGQFDLDGENGPSDLETEDVKSKITEWGGVLTDSFRGDIDYLVLGQQPERPTQPPANAQPWEIRKYISDTKIYDQYLDYLNQARSLSIPVLNQNRLFTLIGYYIP